MKAAVEICCENGIWAELRIANDGGEPARIHDPGDHRPTPGWAFSREAYRIAVLRAFHFLEMTLRAEDGSVVAPSPDLVTRAHHEVGPPVALAPSAELLIRIPLHEFYDLQPGTEYALALTYGDERARLSAAARLRC